MQEIKKVAVLGSGIMGSGIAGHLANCGIPSIMLDIVPPDLPEDQRNDRAARNRIADENKRKMLKSKPAPLYHPDNIDLIETGNLEDDLDRLKECQWVVEVVKEDVEVKRQLFTRIAQHRTPGTILSTNTSGVPLHSMTDVMDDDMRSHFLGTHFFNPPRYLKLLEIIPGPDTKPEVVTFMSDFAENVLGKGVVFAKDTPNFIANRILTFTSQYILHHIKEHGLTVEEVDALTGPEIGHATSATFRTFDLVGLDTYVHVLGNVKRGCPDDERQDLMTPPDYIQKMLDKGLLGEKSGSGFYKRTEERDEKGKRVILGLDLDTLEYRDPVKPRFDCIGAAKKTDSLEEKIRLMHWGEDKGSQFVWKLFSNMAVYTANRIGEIAGDIVNIDNALKWGFAWDVGVFETWDILGVKEVCDRMEKDNLELPPIVTALLDAGHNSFYQRDEEGKRYFFDLDTRSYKPVPLNPHTLILADVRAGGAIVASNESCTLFDLGDGILCAEFHTKMNTIDAAMLSMVLEGVNLINDGKFEGMVLGNQQPHFSAGANLMYVLGDIKQGNWDGVEKAIRGFHDANMAMRFCKGPIVAAPHHYTFGGSVEMSQHTARCVIAGETYGGLVEFGVGIIPAGGGTKEMLRRALAYVPANVPEGDPFPYVRRAFETIAMAKVSTSGPEMVDLGYLTEHDYICIHPDQQIKKAKDVCRGLILAGYHPPRPAKLIALGESARAALRSGVYQLQLGGYASEHDALIARHLANVLTGGDRRPGAIMSEQDVLDLEREAMLSLCGTEKTQQRMQHMLQTGRPLRN